MSDKWWIGIPLAVLFVMAWYWLCAYIVHVLPADWLQQWWGSPLSLTMFLLGIGGYITVSFLPMTRRPKP